MIVLIAVVAGAVAGAVVVALGLSLPGRRRLGGSARARVAELSAQVTRLEQQGNELRRSNAELEQFAYTAGHDLQEPLRKVASFCRMLENRYRAVLDERGRQYIDFAVDGAERMQKLIDDLLDFSRVGRTEDERGDVACEDALRAALDNLGLAGTPVAKDASAAGIGWEPLPTVPGDAQLLTRLFQNLISNAVKFHGEEAPRVHISARDDGPEWTFACSDNGIGIDPADAERIFGMFQRLHPKDAYAGTGIGLALCKKIVEYHGGKIWLDTSPDAPEHGAAIRWTLPKA
jgi:light-regulated signal transduction histidine kinase (bacteriophytochrome)